MINILISKIKIKKRTETSRKKTSKKKNNNNTHCFSVCLYRVILDYKSSLWGVFISRPERVRMTESSGITAASGAAGSGAAGLSSWWNGLSSLLHTSSAYG